MNICGSRFAALAHIVDWVKRDAGPVYVGFAYLNAPQQFAIATKLANPTRLVADRRHNPIYDLSLRPPSGYHLFIIQTSQLKRKVISIFTTT